jgi:glycosyltransferase involved in cell wall biosynthesis
MTRKSICILSYSDIANDARVLRQIQYLSPQYDLTIIGYGKPHPDYPPSEHIHWMEVARGKRSIIRKISDFNRLVRYAVGLVDRRDVLKDAINCKCDVYHANNWDTLPIAAAAARINQARLFLDIHESLNTSNGRIYNWLNRIVVKRHAKEITASSTVVKVIAESYRSHFDLDPIVIMNVPSFEVQPGFSKPIEPTKIRLIHHGVASPVRRSDLLIKVIVLCDDRFELHLAFSNIESEYVARLQELAEQIATGRVYFHPAFPALKIVEEISNFDIGLYPLPPTSYNNKIALPNKLFEFIAAGLAVCIGPSPSMVEIIEKYRCGVVCPSFEPADIAKVINHTSIQQWNEMRRASEEAAKVLNADVEMKKLLYEYMKLFRGPIEE